MVKNNFSDTGYILRKIDLSPQLRLLNREATKIISAANERISTIHNPTIMFNQIILIESRGSSEIENIITTDDELYKEVIKSSPKTNAASKTLRIKSAVKYISGLIDKNKILSAHNLSDVSETINGNRGGFRPTLGTRIIDEGTQEIVHIPPQTKDEVLEHIQLLLNYFNLKGENDPITDALLIHHAFEWIHPFADGNGRIGRILIGAFLKISGETNNVFLPISYFINKKRNVYYEILNEMTKKQNYEKYLSEMYKFLIDAAQYTLDFTHNIDEGRKVVRKLLFNKFKKYDDDATIDALFYNAYTTPKTLVNHIRINYRTIKKIMDFLIESKIFNEKKEGHNLFYINKFLIRKGNNYE